MTLGATILPFDAGEFACETTLAVYVNPVSDGHPIDPDGIFVNFQHTGSEVGTVSRPFIQRLAFSMH